MDLQQPPQWAERLLVQLVAPVDQECIVGDFAERYLSKVYTEGHKAAQRWYWQELLRSLPFLLILLQRQWCRRSTMEKLAYFEKGNRAVILSVILMIPAVLLVCGGLLYSLFDVATVNNALNFNLFIFHPTVILGGMALALLLNTLSVLRIRWEAGTVIGELRVQGKTANLSFIGLIGGVAGIILLYLLAENLQIFAG